MSRTYNLGCCDCKKAICVGQKSGASDGHLYAERSVDIWKFLREHEGHRLIFQDDEFEPVCDFQEVSEDWAPQ